MIPFPCCADAPEEWNLPVNTKSVIFFAAPHFYITKFCEDKVVYPKLTNKFHAESNAKKQTGTRHETNETTT